MSDFVWHCPECGYIVSDDHREYVNVNHDCSRCGKIKVGDYEIGMPPRKEEKDPADWWKSPQSPEKG